MTTTNALEAKLYEQEAKVFLGKVNQGLQIIFDAVDKYKKSVNSSILADQKDIDVLNDFVRTLSIFNTRYYSGYNLAPAKVSEGLLPPLLVKIITEYAAAEFISKVDDIQHLLD